MEHTNFEANREVFDRAMDEAKRTGHYSNNLQMIGDRLMQVLQLEDEDHIGAYKTVCGVPIGWANFILEYRRRAIACGFTQRTTK